MTRKTIAGLEAAQRELRDEISDLQDRLLDARRHISDLQNKTESIDKYRLMETRLREAIRTRLNIDYPVTNAAYEAYMLSRDEGRDAHPECTPEFLVLIYLQRIIDMPGEYEPYYDPNNIPEYVKRLR